MIAISILPHIRFLYFSHNHYLSPLGKVLASKLRLAPPGRYAKPCRLLLLLSILPGPATTHSDGKIGDGYTAWCIAHLWISTEIAHNDNLLKHARPLQLVEEDLRGY